MSLVHRPLIAIALLCAPATAAQSPAPPQPTVIKDVRLVEGADAPTVSILLRNGRVSEVLAAGEELPTGWIEIDGAGALAVPAFVDAFTTAGIDTPEPEAKRDSMSDLAGNVHIGMRDANRKGLQPSLSGASVYSLDEEKRQAHRDYGFATMHSSPSGQLLGGQTLVANLGSGALRDRVLAADLFQAAALRASGRGYPSTLMGYLSHLRQFASDAQWHALRLERQAAGKPDRRPPHDADLEAMGAILAGEQSLVCYADDYGDILRWIQFARNHGMQLVIAGGRDAWMVTDELLAAKVPVLLALDWGDEVEDPDEKKDAGKEADATPEEEGGEETASEPEPEALAELTDVTNGTQDETTEEPAAESSAAPLDAEEAAPASDDKPEQNWTYEEPIEVRRERRRLWAARRDCAIRLHEAGIPFAIGSHKQSAKDVLKNLRKLVEVGLPEEVAMASLTTSAAELLGVEKHVGKIEPGYTANIALWGNSPLADKAKLHWLFIDGERFEFEVNDDAAGEGPAEGVDMNGDWRMTYSDSNADPATLAATMDEDGTLTAVLSFQGPAGDSQTCDLSGHVNGRDITLKGNIDLGGFAVSIQVDATFEDKSFSGEATWKYSGGEDSSSFTAAPVPKRVLEDELEHEGHHHGHGHGPYDQPNSRRDAR